MTKLIHLSDLHIGHDDCGEKVTQIVLKISQTMQPAHHFVVVITGDLVDNASNRTSQEEALAAVNQLKGHGYHVLLIPGNHDYGNGFWASKKYVPHFKKRFYGHTRVNYPKVDVVGDVLFIGLDSTAEELHWYDRMLAEGELGKRQIAKLKRIVDDPRYASMKKVVYLHHHPFDVLFGHQLKDSHLLREAIENKVDVLLFGHLHSDSTHDVNVFNGTWGIKRAYNAGSSTHKNGNLGCHRVIDLDKEPVDDFDAKLV